MSKRGNPSVYEDTMRVELESLRIELVAREGQTAEKEEQVAKRKERLSKSKKRVSERKKRVAEREKRVAERENEVVEREKMVKEREEQTAVGDDQLLSMKIALKNHEVLIAAIEQSLVGGERTLSELGNQLEELQSVSVGFRNSRMEFLNRYRDKLASQADGHETGSESVD